jgi:transposase-like protein
MQCPLCGHAKAHKHAKTTSKGSQRYRCPTCKQTFTGTFDTIYYRRKVKEKRFALSYSRTQRVAVYVALVASVD